MRVETKIYLNRFKPRHYQLPILDAIENKHYKRVMVILPRRSGKDVVAFNLALRQCLKKVCTVYYIFPTYSQAKKVIWDGITIEGKAFLDFIPPELIASKNSSEMKITLINGSILQLIGSDHYDALMGTNPYGCVFSEYALQDPRAYQFIRPILTANDGWALFISTPRGRQNHLYELYQIAKYSKDWFCLHLNLHDTAHIPMERIDKERAEGFMSEELIQQEYFTSFDIGIEGSYYGHYMDKLRLYSQITQVPWEPSFKVHTAWDIGVRNPTTIIFFQVVGQVVRIIDCYENSGFGLEHYAKILSEKPYQYGKHFAPHDIAVKEWGTGLTRFEKGRQLGICFTIAVALSLDDGIEAVRTTLPKVWIDEVLCKPLIIALEAYRREYDSKRKVFRDIPLHDGSSHWADAMRYLSVSLPKTRDSMTQEDIDKIYNEARYGTSANFPKFFRH